VDHRAGLWRHGGGARRQRASGSTQRRRRQTQRGTRRPPLDCVGSSGWHLPWRLRAEGRGALLALSPLPSALDMRRQQRERGDDDDWAEHKAERTEDAQSAEEADEDDQSIHARMAAQQDGSEDVIDKADDPQSDRSQDDPARDGATDGEEYRSG